MSASTPVSIQPVTIDPSAFMNNYIFRLLDFKILKTRALHEDTNHVSFAVKVGDSDMAQPLILHTGDVNDGLHGINLSFGPMPINDATRVTFNYQIVNSGHENRSDIEKALFDGADKLAKGAFATGSVWGIAAGAAIEILKAIFDLNCDGPVAIDQFSFTGAELRNLTPHGMHNEIRNYPGTDSDPFCGGNSNYTVTWSVIRVPFLAQQLIGLVHLQDIGDITFRDNDFAGTIGQARRLEGFQLDFNPPRPDLGLRYMAHLQDIGDTPWVNGGQFVGTRGQSRRLEGFAIELTGPAAVNFNVRYMAHLEGVGDTPLGTSARPYFQNGEFCGTRGQSRRVEGIMVRVDPKSPEDRVPTVG
jgi:hypothetical protein